MAGIACVTVELDRVNAQVVMPDSKLCDCDHTSECRRATLWIWSIDDLDGRSGGLRVLGTKMAGGFGARLVAADEHHVNPSGPGVAVRDVLADVEVRAATRALALTLGMTR